VCILDPRDLWLATWLVSEPRLLLDLRNRGKSVVGSRVVRGSSGNLRSFSNQVHPNTSLRSKSCRPSTNAHGLGMTVSSSVSHKEQFRNNGVGMSPSKDTNNLKTHYVWIKSV